MCSTQNKKNRLNATSKAKNRNCRKPLQERLKKNILALQICNTICLCHQEPKPKYSADTIRKVPPQPCSCCMRERKLENTSSRNKPGISQSANKPDECIPIYIANDNKKGKNLSNCNTEIERTSSNQIQRTPLVKENEKKNNKLFKSRTIMTEDYATFHCIQIEIESDDDASGCNCKKDEEKNVASQTQTQKQQREKQVQTNPSEDKNKMQTKTSKKASKQSKSPQAEPDEKVDPVQDKPTILKRCICFVKKQRHGGKKPQKIMTSEENCECKSKDSHLSMSSECSCENFNETHSASMKAEQSDLNESCCYSLQNSNTELKRSTPNHRKQVGHNSKNPNCAGPQNIQIHIGKSNARITIIRDLD